MLTHTRTLPPYAHPVLTPYSGASAKAWGEFMKEVKIGTSRAETFLEDADPWVTGFDHLGVKSVAGVTQVAQLRIQLRGLNEVKSPKPTPKPTPNQTNSETNSDHRTNSETSTWRKARPLPR